MTASTFTVVNKYTGRVYYKGPEKAEAKAAYRKDPTGSWVYLDGQLCDLRTFAPKVARASVSLEFPPVQKEVTPEPVKAEAPAPLKLEMQPIERIMLRHLFATAKAAGFKLVSVDDGGDELVKVTSEAEALQAVDAVEEARVYFTRPTGNALDWVYVVLGNGADCLSDSSCGYAPWDAVQKLGYEFWDKGAEQILKDYIDELEAECTRLHMAGK